MRRLLILASLGMLLVACGDVPATQTPVYIVVTATPAPVPLTATTSRPSATVPVTLSFEQAHATAQAGRLAADYATATTLSHAAGTATAAIPPATRTAVVAVAAAAAQAGATARAKVAAQSTAQAGATVAAQVTAHALALETVIASDRATVAAIPTSTPLPPSPTNTPLPSFGSTVSVVEWSVSLAKVTGPLSVLTWSDVGNELVCNGKCWLVWIDARNTANHTRALANDLTFHLTDDHGGTYPEDETGPDAYAIQQFKQLQGRDSLDLGTTPRDISHALLTFDIATDARPAALTIDGGDAPTTFNLTPRKKK